MRRPKGTLITELSRLPVGFPDVQGVWVCDAPFVCLLLKEVKEVFDSQRGAVRRDAEDGLKEVIQELLKSSLWRKKKKGGSYIGRDMVSWDVGISRWLLRLI